MTNMSLVIVLATMDDGQFGPFNEKRAELLISADSGHTGPSSDLGLRQKASQTSSSVCRAPVCCLGLQASKGQKHDQT